MIPSTITSTICRPSPYARGQKPRPRPIVKVFANEDAAETWLQENDPEGVVFEYEVLE
jgi:hypothetical protein